MNIYVGEGLLMRTCMVSGNVGIYMITFSNGYFYIGSSSQLNWRIRRHIGGIRSKFIGYSTCSAFKQFRGVELDAIVTLLEPGMTPLNATQLKLRELHYINQNLGNILMLNQRPPITKRVAEFYLSK